MNIKDVGIGASKADYVRFSPRHYQTDKRYILGNCCLEVSGIGCRRNFPQNRKLARPFEFFFILGKSVRQQFCKPNFQIRKDKEVRDFSPLGFKSFVAKGFAWTKAFTGICSVFSSSFKKIGVKGWKLLE